MFINIQLFGQDFPPFYGKDTKRYDKKIAKIDKKIKSLEEDKKIYEEKRKNSTLVKD